MPLEPWQAALIGIAALALGWIVYDLLCRSPIGNNEPLLRCGRLRLCRADELGLHAVLFWPRRAHPHRRADGDDDDRQRLLRHHAEPAQERGGADRRPEARPEMGEDLQDSLDPQQLHHAAGAVSDAVEPLPDDLLEPEGHPAIVTCVIVAGALVRYFYNSGIADHAKAPWWAWAAAAAAILCAFFLAAGASPGMRELLAAARRPTMGLNGARRPRKPTSRRRRRTWSTS